MSGRSSQPSGHDRGGGHMNVAYICGFVFLNSYIIVHMVNVTSRHFAVVFNLPIHNIGIYFSKLYSLRVISMTAGAALEYMIYLIGGNKDEVRKYVSLLTLICILVVRVVLVSLFHFSKSLAYHFYILLILEGLLLGSYQMSLLSLTPQHSAVTVTSSPLAGSYAFLIQKIVDLFLYKKPMLNIKIQLWLCVVTSMIALGMWVYYIFFSGDLDPTDKPKIVATVSQPKCNCVERNKNKSQLEHLLEASSQFLIYGPASFFKDFLYPGVLPFAILERDKCHLINLVFTLLYSAGPLLIYLLNRTVETFKCWDWYCNFFWLFVIPLTIIMLFSFLAIHSRIPAARVIINSQPRAFAMSICLILCFGITFSVSYVSVANYVHHASGNKEKSLFIVTLHNLHTTIYRFIFSKLSVGYNSTRLSLGYHLPRFRPRHRMSKWNTFWYIIRNTFYLAQRDIISDFKMDITKYL